MFGCLKHRFTKQYDLSLNEEREARQKAEAAIRNEVQARQKAEAVAREVEAENRELQWQLRTFMASSIRLLMRCV
jgi:hypothetical protein